MTMIPAEIFAATIYREVGNFFSFLILKMLRFGIGFSLLLFDKNENFNFSGFLSWSLYLIHGLFRK
jgi:hypothetical protein